MIIREMIIDGTFDGVNAISLVDAPAIESNFVYFNEQVQLRTVDIGKGYYVDLDEFWLYTAAPEPETIPTSHRFCKDKAGKVWHIKEINSWAKFNKTYRGKPSAFIDEQGTYFASFRGINSASFNIDKQIYNCRHHFRRVRRIRDIPIGKQLAYRKKYPTKIKNSKHFNEIQFKIDKEKREIVGVVMIPNIMIYRQEIGDTRQDGYVWFSKKTIQQMKDVYGYNRTLTIQHQDDITGRGILMDSWVYPFEKEETFGIEASEGSWFQRWKIIDEDLWNVIKDRKILGFSIEGMFNLRDPKN